MFKYFSGYEKVIIILILSITCFVSSAKGLPNYEGNFINPIHFSFDLNRELTSKIHFHEKFMGQFNSISHKIKQVYFIFLIKILEKSEFRYSLIFIIFFSLWFYRKYEIIKIKKRNSVRSKAINIDLDQKPLPGELNHFNVGEDIINTFAGNLKPQYCIYSAENTASFNSDNLNGSAERDILRILLTSVNRDTFCKYICSEKNKCYYPFAKLLVKEPFIKQSENSDLSSDVLKTNDGFHVELETIYKSSLSKVSISPENKEFLDKTILILNWNYTDYRFSAARLAEELDMSISQVNRKMNLLAGCPSGRLIRKFRLQKAATLLMKGSVSVSEVCFSTGFNDLSYFSRAFKKQFDCSPSSYRQQMTKKS